MDNKTDKNIFNVTFKNLTDAQKIALEEFFAVWNYTGEKKLSIWTAFMCDGSMDWKPQIEVNGNEPKRYMGDIGLRAGKIKIVQKDDSTVDDDMYFLDYMKIQDNLINFEEK